MIVMLSLSSVGIPAILFLVLPVTQRRGTSRVAHESSFEDQIIRMQRRGSRCIPRASRCNGNDVEKKRERETERSIKKAQGGRNAVFYAATRWEERRWSFGRTGRHDRRQSCNPFTFRLVFLLSRLPRQIAASDGVNRKVETNGIVLQKILFLNHSLKQIPFGVLFFFSTFFLRRKR